MQVKEIYSLLPSTSVRLSKPPESYMGSFKYFMGTKMSNVVAPGVPSQWGPAIPGGENREDINLHSILTALHTPVPRELASSYSLPLTCIEILECLLFCLLNRYFYRTQEQSPQDG